MQRVQRMYRVLVLILLLFMVGCAPKVMIMFEGAPVPDYAYRLTNPHTGLTAEIIAARYDRKYESGEPVLWPVFMNVDKTYKIDPVETARVEITVKVRNPNKVYYELVENVLESIPFDNLKSQIASKSIYRGRLRYNNFKFFYPIANEESMVIKIEVRGKEGSPLLTFGNFSYMVKKRESATSERGDAFF